jgi:hypothetical protein
MILQQSNVTFNKRFSVKEIDQIMDTKNVPLFINVLQPIIRLCRAMLFIFNIGFGLAKTGTSFFSFTRKKNYTCKLI